MPKEDGVGYGRLTPLKIEHLSKIFAMHLRITQNVLKKHTYYLQRYRYVDLTAGKGSTPDGLSGSPLIFLKEAQSEDFQLEYRADFIEQAVENINELQLTVLNQAKANNWPNQDKSYFHQGMYQEIIPGLFPHENKKELGLVFVDHSGDLPDFNILSQIVRMRPKMEILLYISSTNIKRVHHLNGKLLSDYMQDMGKKNWLIRKPIPGDSLKWTFLLGSDSDIFKRYKKIDFLRLSSKEAQNFFPFLNLSQRQITDSLQSNFFDDLDV